MKVITDTTRIKVTINDLLSPYRLNRPPCPGGRFFAKTGNPAPGDDGSAGTAAGYDLRYSTAGHILSGPEFDNATQSQGEPAPNNAGSPETFTITGLDPGTTYFFALKATDEAGNISGLSNSLKGVTEARREKIGIRISTGDAQIVNTGTYSEPMITLANIFGTTSPASGAGIDFSISTYPAGAEGQSLTKSSETTDADGLADVRLKLGNIPAEYGVTATCNSCEPSASSVTFKCCGKLATNEYRQGDSRWSAQILGNNPPANTIGAVGCAVTSVANMINFYNTGNQTNPGQLNQDMIANRVYNSSDDILWERVGNVPVAAGIHYVGARDFPFYTRDDLRESINADLGLRHPIILRTQRPGRQFPHFILAVGKCGASYMVADPGSATGIALYNPDNLNQLLMGVRRYASQ